MNKTVLLLSLLALLVTLALGDNITNDKASMPSGPILCDKSLYKSLSKLKGRIKGPGVQFDLLRTLNRTDVSNPKKVLQRVSQYDFNAVKDYLDILDRSYAYEQVYVKLNSAEKASLDYENVCADICPTYTTYNGFRTPKNVAAPKPANLDNFTCSVPDNPFCNDGLKFADVKDEELVRDIPNMSFKMDHTGRLIVYKKYNGSRDLEYCYTVDEEVQMIVHMCEKYEEYILATGNYLKTVDFHDQAYETVLTGDPDSQTAINYIMTKMKFGERIGAIYSDCRRYGKLPTDIKKPPII